MYPRCDEIKTILHASTLYIVHCTCRCANMTLRSPYLVKCQEILKMACSPLVCMIMYYIIAGHNIITQWLIIVCILFLLVKCVRSKPAYFAEKLYKSMKVKDNVTNAYMYVAGKLFHCTVQIHVHVSMMVYMYSHVYSVYHPWTFDKFHALLLPLVETWTLLLCVHDVATICLMFIVPVPYNIMQGLGTNDRVLVRVMVSRCEVDMVQIKKIFYQKYHKTLGSFIKVRGK